jgi:pimeloyl-ACP methyl ester carboxylesterase
MAEQGRAGEREFLAPWRERMLADPVAGLQAAVADSPPQDHDWLARPDVQRVHAESLTDALAPGLDGWVDDGMSLDIEPWGFDLAAISCPTHFWHSDDDANCPLSATRRLAGSVPDARLTVWEGQGHTAPSRNAEQVLAALIAAARARELAPS